MEFRKHLSFRKLQTNDLQIVQEWLEARWSQYESSYFRFQASIAGVADFEAYMVLFDEKPIGLVAVSQKSANAFLSLPDGNTTKIETFIAVAEHKVNSVFVQAEFINQMVDGLLRPEASG